MIQGPTKLVLISVKSGINDRNKMPNPKSQIFWENIHMNYPEERNRERLSAEHW